VQAILQISTVMREGEEKVLLFQKGQAEGAQKHIEMLEKARQDAQDAKAEAEKLRVSTLLHAARFVPFVTQFF
jgi:hypothetical protein